MTVFVVIVRSLRMFVVDADRIPVIRKFLDDPTVLRAFGLNLIKVTRLANEPEVSGSEKRAFLRSEHQHPSSNICPFLRESACQKHKLFCTTKHYEPTVFLTVGPPFAFLVYEKIIAYSIFADFNIHVITSILFKFQM